MELCAFPQPHRGAKICAQSHLVCPLALSPSARIKSSACPNQQMENISSVSGDTQPVASDFFVCSEAGNVESGDWHGGEFLHEDDCQVSSSGNDPCAKHGGGLVLFCFASYTSRPPGSLHLSLDFNSTDVWNPYLDLLHEGRTEVMFVVSSPPAGKAKNTDSAHIRNQGGRVADSL